MSSVADDVAAALGALGEAMRGWWGDIDGRSIQYLLDGLAAALTSGEFVLADWWQHADICPRCHQWTGFPCEGERDKQTRIWVCERDLKEM